MFAVIKISGHQYRVSTGDKIVVGKIEGNVGEKVSMPALLTADGSDVKLGQEAANVHVLATIIAHEKGDKIHIRRYRSKSRHRRHIGFRSQLTTIQIDTIGDTKKTAAKEVSAKTTGEKSAKPSKRKTKSA